jgi:hypothetical protein
MRSLSLALLLSVFAGCLNTDNVPTVASGPTWNHDVQPLIAAHCQSCHTAGGIAPFALDSYAQAKPQAFALVNATASRRMPPWMPEEQGCVPLRDSRRLTDAQLQLFSDWAAAGAPEGDPQALEPAAQQKGLERVDAVLKIQTPYTPQASLTDDYRCFILPHGQTVDRDIVGVNVRPDVRAMVHHVIIYSLDPALAKSQDDAEAGEGWTCFAGPGQNAKMLGGWVPGTSATQYPDGTGVTLEASQAVVIQVHYNLNATSPQPDQTSLELQFSPTRVARPAEFTAMANWWFNIPPQAMDFTATANIKPPTGGTVWGVVPHMHTKGRHISVKKSGQCLIDVPNWDFHWQQPFFFASNTGLPFAAGEAVDLSCTWDNPTASNVTWGEKTTDEMCLAYFYVTR